VLRSFTGRRVERALPADPVDALATRLSFPTWRAARWVERYGAEEAEALMRAMNERPPLVVRTNTLRTTRAELTERLARETGLAAEPTRFAPDGLVLPHEGAPASWPAFSEGHFAVQDEASILVSHLVAPRPDETVADECAAPGTKTTHLAQLMDNPAGGFEAVCDAVLVDAPCSNLGVLRRNPDVKWRRAADDLRASAERQRGILAVAASMVKPRGRLVYATCTLEPEENDGVTSAFVAAHPEFRVDPPADFPIAPDADGCVRCLPHRHGTDGFTMVRLRRGA
jgi:16S rRNA (cytosine967-C5)-methyltransferase